MHPNGMCGRSVASGWMEGRKALVEIRTIQWNYDLHYQLSSNVPLGKLGFYALIALISLAITARSHI